MQKSPVMSSRDGTECGVCSHALTATMTSLVSVERFVSLA